MNELKVGQRWTPKNPHMVRYGYVPVTIKSFDDQNVVVELDPPFEKQIHCVAISILREQMVPE